MIDILKSKKGGFIFFLSLALWSCKEDFELLRPSVETQEVTDVTHESALSGVIILDDGGDPIQQKGLAWGISSPPTIEDNQTLLEGDNMEASLTGLQPGTHYFVRAFARNRVDISYGREYEFKTSSTYPRVALLQIENITVNSARVNAEMESYGGSEVAEKGFCWGRSSEPTLEDGHVIFAEGEEFNQTLSGLEPDTQYFVRAFARNEVGLSYSEEYDFYTKDRLPEAPALPGKTAFHSKR
ncbi:hypothetical protein KIH41_16390 [Litoribacter ruber]|uniref:fibronectin type III domain-containing protein n=1 Tax=Litoribacter ruber TaxID=702568 RepID=UPI001BD9FE55|nr:fibronectin type III domain-containing protein [Litoribacter ruber]MBT0812867.1 hypothetical protein [Litoribacter ruber]